MSLWEEGKRERRLRIVRAARALIATGGLEAVSMRKLADEARVSVGTLYNLFGSRDDIVVAAIDGAIDEIAATVVLDESGDPLAHARLLVSASVRYFTADPATYRPLLLAAFRTEKSRATTELFARCVGSMAGFMAGAVERGWLRDDVVIEVAAVHAFESFMLASFAWARGDLDDDGFLAQGQYGLALTCLALAKSTRVRSSCLEQIRELEPRLLRALLASRDAAAETPRRRRRERA